MAENSKILIIDDEEVICNLLSDLLKNLGYEPHYALTAQEGIALAERHTFGVVITDLKIPDMDGIAVLRELKRTDPDRIVIIYTGYPSFDTVQAALRSGAHDYITKPFDIKDISFLVKKAFEFYRLSVQNRTLCQQLEEKNRDLEKKIDDKVGEVELISEIAKDVSSILELNEALKMIVNRVSSALHAEMCSVLIFDKNTQLLTIRASQGLSKEVVASTAIKPGEKVTGWVFERREGILVKDVEQDPRFAKRNQEKYYTHSFISVPLIVKDEAVGVLNLNNKTTRQPFSEDEFRLVLAITHELGFAIKNASLYTSLEDSYIQTVKTLTAVIDAKDKYTYKHSENVTTYAAAIATALGLSQTEVEVIQKACQLHDIGKIGVHDNILTKPGKLTPEEWEEMKQHPFKGVAILKPLMFLDNVFTLIEQHHERYDGKGYPYGLQAENIKLGARIIAVADSYDAMTTRRPYREPLTKEQAVEEIKRNSGTQFDPEVVAAFLRICDKLPSD